MQSDKYEIIDHKISVHPSTNRLNYHEVFESRCELIENNVIIGTASLILTVRHRYFLGTGHAHSFIAFRLI